MGLRNHEIHLSGTVGTPPPASHFTLSCLSLSAVMHGPPQSRDPSIKAPVPFFLLVRQLRFQYYTYSSSYSPSGPSSVLVAATLYLVVGEGLRCSIAKVCSQFAQANMLEPRVQSQQRCCFWSRRIWTRAVRGRELCSTRAVRGRVFEHVRKLAYLSMCASWQSHMHVCC